MKDDAARLAVVLVNWNGWADTVECIESVLRSDVPVRVIVVDNASTDGSADRIVAWASGEVPFTPPSGPLGRLTTPPFPKPVAHERIGREAAAAGGGGDVPLTIIDAGGNVGFAAGCNIGLRHAMNDPAVAYGWCLNNDTVVEPSAVRALIARMDATHKVGMCGTVVRYYHRPGVVQALNGSKFPVMTSVSRNIGLNQPAARPFDPAKVARDTDFVLGASLAVSRAFLANVGYMHEDYFLYFEEMDWTLRNRGRFTTAFAHGAVVYHKEGGSIGSSSKKGNRSALSEYYLLRSRLKFYRRHYPLLLPFHWLFGAALIGRRVLRRQPGKAAAMTRALLGMRYNHG